MTQKLCPTCLLNKIEQASQAELMCWLQGDPNQNLLIQMAVTLEICIFGHMMIKPKCVLGAFIYFDSSAVCLQLSAVCLQFSIIYIGTRNTFWLYQKRSKTHIFRVIPILISKFWFRHPVGVGVSNLIKIHGYGIFKKNCAKDVSAS